MPVEVKEIQVGYLHSPYFKDLYLYLLQNRLPSSEWVIRKLETLSEKYVLLDSLLFRISPEKRDSGSSNTRNMPAEMIIIPISEKFISRTPKE